MTELREERCMPQDVCIGCSRGAGFHVEQATPTDAWTMVDDDGAGELDAPIAFYPTPSGWAARGDSS